LGRLTREQAGTQVDLYRELCVAWDRHPGAIVLRRDIITNADSSRRKPPP
jgi:hypothetical protein